MAETTIVLLPGLDGTGTLFRPLIEQLPSRLRPVVVAYPGKEKIEKRRRDWSFRRRHRGMILIRIRNTRPEARCLPLRRALRLSAGTLREHQGLALALDYLLRVYLRDPSDEIHGGQAYLRK